MKTAVQIRKDNESIENSIRNMMASEDGKVFAAYLQRYVEESSFDQDAGLMSFKEGIRHLARTILDTGDTK